MTKTLTIRSLVLALLLALGFQSVSAQTFWTETFSDQASATTNWTSGGTNAGTEVWTWSNDPLAGFQDPAVPGLGSPTANDGYFYFNSDANGDGNAHDVTLTGFGNPANATGKTNVHLRFYTQFIYDDENNIQVGVSTDGGLSFTYHTVLAALPSGAIYDGTVEVAIPEADGHAQVWLQFRDIGTWEYHWKVDDLELYTVSGPVPCNANPNAIICDDFETYNVGNISPQSNHWIPWDLSDIVSNNISAEVSTDFASNGTKSMKVKQDGNGDDQLLQLGNKTTGRYSLKWKYYIPTGKAGYFNIQTDEENPGGNPPNSANFAAEVYFRATGVVDVTSPTPAVAGTYPQGQWFPVEIVVDLDNNLAKMFVNGSLLRAWAYTGDFGGIDYYAADATYIAYVDEVEYVALDPIVYDVDNCGAAVDLTQYFGQTPNVPQTTGLYDNTNATPSATDPAVTCWGETAGADIVDGSMWYTFTGDGGSYHIETVPCNATNYIGTAQQDPGDTQMLVYSGNDCDNLTEVVCNDDLFATGTPDWRAGLDIQTVSGQNYYMLLDGFNFQGTVALGEFCVQITQIPSVTCANGSVGTYTVANGGFVCNLANLGAIITVDETGFAIPNEGPVYGMLWSLSSAPVPAGVWPADAAGFLGGTGVLQNVFAVGLVNDNDPFVYGSYYITPVVLGGATDTDLTNGPSVFDVDPSTGCFFVGESVLVTLMPPLNDLAIDNADVTSSSIDITVSGGIAEFLQDPSLYQYSWTGPGGFTANTEDITGLTVSGAYTVVISDPSGCIDAYSQTFDVTTGTDDPSSIKSLTISPNPTRNSVMLNLSLAQAAEVRIDVVNTIGQVLQTINAGKLSNLNQSINLNDLSDGTYFLRISVDGDVTQRGVVLQR